MYSARALITNPAVNLKDLGARIRREREHLGLSLEKLGAQAGVSASRINQIENCANSELTGKVRVPKPATLNKLAGALKVPAEDLLELAGYRVERKDESPALFFTKDPDDDLMFDLEKFMRLGKDILELTLEEQQQYSRLFETISQNVKQQVKRRKK